MDTVSTQGVTNVPLQGVTNVPLQGVTNVPLQGVTNVPLQGVTNVPLQGVTNVPLQGVTNVPLQGVTNVPLQGVTNVPLQGVTNVPLPGVTNVPLQGVTNQGVARYLVLDPATTTGYCVMEADFEGKANITSYGILEVDISSEYQGDHCLDLMRKLRELIDLHKIQHIAVEAYFFSKKFCTGSNVNAAFRTAIHIVAREYGFPYTILNISAWKTFVAGHSTPTKIQKAHWGKARANKIFIQEALFTRFGFRFPNHMTSPATGRWVHFKHDIVDAVAQAVYFARIVLAMRTVTLDPVPAPDVVWPKTALPGFVYPSSDESAGANAKTTAKAAAPKKRARAAPKSTAAPKAPARKKSRVS